MDKHKTFNLFNFLSTLARTLIDCFIPVILYNKGLNIKGILFFLLLNYSISFLVNVPLGYIGKKITFKWAMIASSFFMGISYYFLLALELNVFNIFVFTFTHVVNSNIYWVSRHYYALEVLPKREMASEVGNIVIFSTLAVIPISYIGALLMNRLELTHVVIIIMSLYVISVLPLFRINEEKKKTNQKLLDIAFDIPRRSILFMILAQFRMISRYLFPLFLFLHVERNYEFIGIFNIVVGIASTIFVYFFAKKMDQKKKDYLFLSGILGCIVYILKLNIHYIFLVLAIGFIEGITDKMYEVAFNRNLYALGTHYDGINYSILMEGFQNISRVVIIMFFAFIIVDLKLIFYFSAFMLVLTGFVGFDDGEGGY